ncbi:MAG: glutamate racemase [Burkholderiales bacterium PBB1]|nr:MAG: glutamate racemase [Burkholderiales bacterium PBB1]
MLNLPGVAASIGVYDSGVGGLSVLRALRLRLPGESFTYVADCGHAPYGDRPASFVEGRARYVAQFLTAHGAKALVVACNTASVVAVQRLREQYTLPIVAMEPAIKPAVQISRSKVVLVLATSNTIRSPSVARLCSMYGTDTRIILQACPGLADQVERGRFHDDETQGLLASYLRPGLDAGADTIVLGCTHYAFLVDAIARIAGNAVTIVEPSEAIASQLSRVIAAPADSARHPLAGDTTFFTSGPPHELAAFLAHIGEPSSQVLALPGS